MSRRITAALAALAAILTTLIGSTDADALSWETATAPRIVVNVGHIHHGWRPYFTTAVRTWNDNGANFVRRTHCVDGVRCVRVVERQIDTDNVAAHTLIWSAGDRIVKAPWLVVDPASRHWPFAVYGHRLNLALHELGHVLGLPHDSSSGCMWPYVDQRHAHVSTLERHRLARMYPGR